MKAVLQRVSSGAVKVNGELVSSIGKGILILLGIENSDTSQDALLLAEKIVNLRIFEDEDGKMNLSIKEAGGEFLVVSQFTLCADLRKGRRPSFSYAAQPQFAIPLYEQFIAFLAKEGVNVKSGIFGAKMLVEIFNDGPVTFYLDSKGLK